MRAVSMVTGYPVPKHLNRQRNRVLESVPSDLNVSATESQVGVGSEEGHLC